MYLAYYDEAGDDGFPRYSSPIFVLTAAYLHYLHWKNRYDSIHNFRHSLKERFGIPVNVEFHCKLFLLDKDPFREFKLTGK